jgi:putative membrane protein
LIRLGTLLGLLGLAGLAALLAYEGIGPVFSTLAEGGFGLVWASLFHIVPMTVNAAAWQRLFVAGRRPALATMTLAVWIRESTNGLLPVARIGGEVVSYRVLTARGFGKAPVAASLIADLSLSMVSQFLFTVTGLVLLLLRIEDASVLWRVLGGLMAFIPMVAGLFAIQRIGIVTLGSRLVAALFGDRWGDLVGNAARLDRVLRLVYRRRSRVLAALFFQSLGWVLGSGEIWLALYFIGQPIPFIKALMLEALAQAVSSAAFVVPGALGVQEGSFVLFGGMLGLDPSVALAVGLARRIRDIVIFGPGLLLWQFGEARRLVQRRAGG